jgi:hypothetical protein
MSKALPLRRWSLLLFRHQQGYKPNKWATDNVHGRTERFVVGTTGRQVGKSTAGAIEIDEGMTSAVCTDANCNSYGQPPSVVVLAADYSKADLIVGPYIEMLTETFGKESYRLNQNKHELQILDPMAGTVGASLKWLSAEEEYGVVGGTYSKAIIDEAQAISDKVWFKFLPTCSVRSAQIIVFGTPDITTDQTWFQGLWLRGQDELEKDYHSFSVASWETTWMDMDSVLQAKDNMTENEFRRLYGGEWVADDGAFFTSYKEAMFEHDAEFDPMRRYVMSIDFAVENDYNVVLVGDVATRTVVHKERWNKTEPIDTYERILDIWIRWNRPRTVADNSGLGRPMVQELTNRGMPVIPFTWTASNKMPTLGKLAADLQHRRIMFPKKWDDLQREFRGFLRKRTPNGSLTASAASGFTDDIIMSLALLNELMSRTRSGGQRKRRNYLEDVA